MPAPYPPIIGQLDTALLVTVRDGLRWESALAPVTASGTYSGTLYRPDTDGVVKAYEYGQRDRELAWLDTRNAAAVVEVALEVADVWHASANRPRLAGPQIGHFTYTGQDTSGPGLLSKVVHVKNASVPVDALATDADLKGRDTLVYETLYRAVRDLFTRSPITSSGVSSFTDVTAWSLATGTELQKDVSASLPMNRDLFRDPDFNLAERDNQMAGYVATMCQLLKNPFAYANRLYIGIYGVGGREVETYTLTQDKFIPGQAYGDGDEITRDDTTYRVRPGTGTTTNTPWTSPGQWEAVSARKRVWTCEPALPGRNRIVYNIETQELQWFGISTAEIHAPQIVALSIPGIVAGQTITVQPGVPERKDGQFWRRKAALIVPEGGTLLDRSTLQRTETQRTSGFQLQKECVSLTVPSTGLIHFPDQTTGSYPQALPGGFYRAAALVEVNSTVVLRGSQNAQAYSGTLSGVDYPGPRKVSWQVSLPPGQWQVEVDYTNLAGSTDGFQVTCDLDGAVIFDDTVPLTFVDGDGEPLVNGTLKTTAPFLFQPTGQAQVFGLNWSGGNGAFHVRELRFTAQDVTETRIRMSGTLAGSRAVADVVGQNLVPGVIAWDFQAGSNAYDDLRISLENPALLPVRVLQVDVARFGTSEPTPNTQGFEAYRSDCLNRAVRSAQQSFTAAVQAGVDLDFSAETGVWTPSSTDRWMSTLEQAEPRLRTRSNVQSGFICPDRQYVVAKGSLVYEGNGYAVGSSFIGHVDDVYVWASAGTLNQDGAWQPSRATHLGRPALVPAGVYFDYSAGTVAQGYDATYTTPEVATLQPWMIAAGFYTAQSEFWTEPTEVKTSVLAPPPPDVYYTVAVSSSPSSGGTVSGAGLYIASGYGTLTATANPSPLPGAKPVDILFLVDESGSMSTEHAWIGTMPLDLEAALLAAGIGVTLPNRYGLLGFAESGHQAEQKGHKHIVGGADFGSASDLAAAAAGLELLGNTEDGYEAIKAALAGYTFRAGAVVMVVLITDESRTVIDAGATYAYVKAALEAQQAVFAIVGNFLIKDNTTAVCMGRKGAVTYKQSGASYVTTTFGSIITGDVSLAPTVVADYGNLAEDVSGTTWDLNILRAGGVAATAFSAAFTDINKNAIYTNSFYTFDHWVINGVTYTSNPYVFIATESLTAQAVFV